MGGSPRESQPFYISTVSYLKNLPSSLSLRNSFASTNFSKTSSTLISYSIAKMNFNSPSLLAAANAQYIGQPYAISGYGVVSNHGNQSHPQGFRHPSSQHAGHAQGVNHAPAHGPVANAGIYFNPGNMGFERPAPAVPNFRPARRRLQMPHGSPKTPEVQVVQWIPDSGYQSGLSPEKLIMLDQNAQAHQHAGPGHPVQQMPPNDFQIGNLMAAHGHGMQDAFPVQQHAPVEVAGEEPEGRSQGKKKKQGACESCKVSLSINPHPPPILEHLLMHNYLTDTQDKMRRWNWWRQFSMCRLPEGKCTMHAKGRSIRGDG